jgi:hypothetical protein
VLAFSSFIKTTKADQASEANDVPEKITEGGGTSRSESQTDPHLDLQKLVLAGPKKGLNVQVSN